MNLKLIMHLFSACVLICAVAGQCPVPDDPALKLESNTSSVVTWSYTSIKGQISGSRTNGTMLLDTLENSKCADLSDEPSDNPDQIPRSKALRVPVLLFPVRPAKNACESCPPKVNFLARFYGSCYVITPNDQQVRYVTCNRRCQQPCMCSRSYCQRTHYTKVWFFSYCTRRVGGFQIGLNFRFLWLPQDCRCINY